MTAPDVRVVPWAQIGGASMFEVLVDGRRVGFARDAGDGRWWWSPSLYRAISGTRWRGTMDEMRAWAAGRAE